MDAPTRHQVSLRGASAREITRDDLLQRVSHEREARHFARRAASAALFIQRVWRRYNLTKRVALQLQKEWTILVNNGSESMTKTWISCSLLRPVIFIMIHLVVRPCKIQAQDISCMRSCFIILLESLNSTDPGKNLCSLAMGTLEERRIWNYQVQKLVYLSSFMLAKHDGLNSGSDDMVALTALSMRLVITLSDLKGWKCITDENYEDADKAVKGLIRFMGSSESGLYRAIGRYLSKLHVSLIGNAVQRDDKLLISASAITLAIRPFQLLNQDVNEPVPLEIQCTAEQYCVFILAIPWLIQRTPAVLLPALRHKSVLITCFRTILILDEKVLVKCAEIDQSRASSCPNGLPQVGWLLSNIICLATESENNSVDPSRFTDGVDLVSYIHVINLLAESLLAVTENIECMQKETEELPEDEENSMDFASKFVLGSDANSGSLKYMDLLRPICQQWHLCKLMTAVRGDFKDEIGPPMETSSSQNSKTLKLLDIAQFYSNMIRIYSLLNSMAGPLPVLNMLSFIPGFLVNIWGALEHSLFPAGAQTSGDDNARARSTSRIKSESDSSKKQKHPGKDAGNRLASVFHKISGKSTAEVDNTVLAEGPREHNTGGENAFDVWIVKSLKCGPESVSKDTSCLLYLFCTTYAHLLLVLDDIEFYEKQVPFSLEQQQRIASMLNTLVYNGLLHNTGCRNRPLMNAAVRCLQMLYERDCRHRFCPPALWLSPAEKSRPPIAMAARTHEVLSDVKLESSSATSVTSFITTTPYVYPFEERVQMFREFIRMDKASRKMAGELTGPGDRSIEIVIRRDHLVEDGFHQLNRLGSRLKLSIHVSFVSECGLPEAGLDYGGLSKEFLTDMAKAAFDPRYGLFCQTSTSERLLIPNTAARFQENGIQMIEFLGRIVGKALYEGILLDYSFSNVFVQKLLGRYNFIDELSTLDPELYKNLMCVKHYDGDVKELSLDFTVTEEVMGKRHVIELKPGGQDTSVTNKNKLQYIHAIADYKLNRQILPFSNAFFRGLADLISPSWLKLFNASEFNQLLSGGNHDIDVDDLRRNTRYTGGYSEGSRTVKLFWEVMAGFEPKERCMLLKFVTSCSRAPLLGFKHLQPSFTIHKVPCDVPLWGLIGGQDVERLPSASTCYNTLKLPTYKRASTLKAKLLYAINSNAGFELS